MCISNYKNDSQEEKLAYLMWHNFMLSLFHGAEKTVLKITKSRINKQIKFTACALLECISVFRLALATKPCSC